MWVACLNASRPHHPSVLFSPLALSPRILLSLPCSLLAIIHHTPIAFAPHPALHHLLHPFNHPSSPPPSPLHPFTHHSHKHTHSPSPSPCQHLSLDHHHLVSVLF